MSTFDDELGHLPHLIELVVDALDPHLLGRFWAAALGWDLETADDEVMLLPNDGTPFPILFERVTEPKIGQNNIHLDLTTTSLEDQRGTVERLIELGGRRVDIGQNPEESHVVLADPEGNELCILGPGNNFLAGCGRLGAINADGHRDTGVFWSEALGWPLMWDQDEETAIRPPGGGGPVIQWSGPPLMEKFGKNRLHLDIAPPVHVDQQAEVDRLIGLGARPVDIGQGDVSWVVMADPDGNEFCVLSPR